MEKKTIEPPEKKGVDYVRCPKHGVSFPKGSECPMCAAEG